MVNINRLLITTTFIVSIGVIPVSLCTQSHLAYGANQAEVDKLLKTGDCPGCDLVGAELAHASLQRAHLNGANLQKANLAGADLRSAKLVRANLSEANLLGANLSRANLYHAIFSGANLKGANLDMAIFMGATFDGAEGLSREQKKYLRKHAAINVPE